MNTFPKSYINSILEFTYIKFNKKLLLNDEEVNYESKENIIIMKKN